MFRKLIYIFLISMVPVIELRGAIPAGFLMNLPWYYVLLFSVVGNLLPVPFILFFIEKILDIMKQKNIFPKLVHWLEEKAQKGAKKVEKYALLGLFLFVAVPLPGTGAWTGSLVAALFHMDQKWAFLSVFCGVVAAGVVVTLIAYGAIGGLSFLI